MVKAFKKTTAFAPGMLAYFPLIVTLIITLLALLPNSSWALQLIAEREEIALNETLRLEIRDNTGGDLDALDLSSIEINFTILNRSSQTEIAMINGRTESNKTLVLMLAPRKVGSSLIPPLRLNGRSSKAIKIKVNKPLPVPSGLTDQSVMIESEVDQPEVIVGGQLLYTYRVIYRVRLNNAEIAPLSIDNAEVIALEDKNYTRSIGGNNYNVTEKRYAIFFNQPDNATIPAQTLSALLPNNQRRSFGFDPFSRGKELRLESKPIAVSVTERPANKLPTGQVFLPAQSVTISEKLSSEKQQARVAEPITRSISVVAKGLPADLLPTIAVTMPDGINSYSEKPELLNQEFVGGIASKRTDTIAMVPTRPGRYTLPAIKLPWWNTDTQQWEIAELPEKTIAVLPSLTSPTVDTSASNETDADNSTSEAAPTVNASPIVAATATTQRFWQGLAITMTLLWLLTLGFITYFALRNRPNSRVMEEQPQNTTLFKQVRSELSSACKQGDAVNAKRLLQHWLTAYEHHHASNHRSHNTNHNTAASAALLSGKPRTLSATANNAELNIAMAELDSYLFSDSTVNKPWNGEPLLKAINSIKLNKAKSADNATSSELKPLYGA